MPSPVPCSQASSYLPASVRPGAGVTSAMMGPRAQPSPARPCSSVLTFCDALELCHWVPDAVLAGGPHSEHWALSAVVGSVPTSCVGGAATLGPCLCPRGPFSHCRQLPWGRVCMGLVSGSFVLIPIQLNDLSSECHSLTFHVTWGHLGSHLFSCSLLTVLLVSFLTCLHLD